MNLADVCFESHFVRLLLLRWRRVSLRLTLPINAVKALGDQFEPLVLLLERNAGLYELRLDLLWAWASDARQLPVLDGKLSNSLLITLLLLRHVDDLSFELILGFQVHIEVFAGADHLAELHLQCVDIIGLLPWHLRGWAGPLAAVPRSLQVRAHEPLCCLQCRPLITGVGRFVVNWLPFRYQLSIGERVRLQRLDLAHYLLDLLIVHEPDCHWHGMQILLVLLEPPLFLKGKVRIIRRSEDRAILPVTQRAELGRLIELRAVARLPLRLPDFRHEVLHIPQLRLDYPLAVLMVHIARRVVVRTRVSHGETGQPRWRLVI